MALPSLILGLVKPAIEGIFRWKEGADKMEISRQDFELMRMKLEAEIQIKLDELERKPTQEFRQFVTEYEGAAKDQTPFIKNLRSSVRPLITYWSVGIITALMFGWLDGDELTQNLSAIPDPLWQIFLAIFGFWFGGRAAMQLAETWKKGETERQREEARGRAEESMNKAREAEANASVERVRMGHSQAAVAKPVTTAADATGPRRKTEDFEVDSNHWIDQDFGG